VEDLSKILSDHFGSDGITVQYNEMSDFVLAFSKKDTNNIPGTEVLKYIILRVKDNKIIREDAVPGGSIKWIDTYHVEVVEPPGMPEAGTDLRDYTFKYSVKEKINQQQK
jgi:hypothetical protein